MSFPQTRTPGAGARPPLSERAERLLLVLDRLFDRLYTARYNPLYQSGPLAVGMLLVMILTGLYLLLFYQTASPYESVQAMHNNPWLGRWIRSLHRYSADVAMAAVGVHMVRMFLQGRTWGPRALAWITGVGLLGLLLLSGWTGMVLVWDVQGQAIAIQGARLLDLLPVFTEPMSRTFLKPSELGVPFFFLNLFVHIVLPLAMALGLWVHTSRVARPALLPPRRLWWATVALLIGLSVLFPVRLAPPADLLEMVGRLPLDWFYAFWVPLSRAVPPLVHGLLWLGAVGLLVSVPLWWRPRPQVRREPSFVNEYLCTGCTQCYLDCPYEAITMVPRTVGQGSELVARVDPAMCVSCGICAGSCAPMQIGPPGRSGQDQLQGVAAYFKAERPGPGTVVVFSCANAVGDDDRLSGLSGVDVHTVRCAGSVHTSVVEYLLRRGVAGVYLLSCPGRDCVHREGPKWLNERLYHDREAELKARVDRRRVRLGQFGYALAPEAAADVRAFREGLLTGRGPMGDEGDVELDSECQVPEVSHG